VFGMDILDFGIDGIKLRLPALMVRSVPLD
jgi:hypothetical protein